MAEVILLASTSPRREEIMRQLSLPFKVLARPVDESGFDHEDAQTTAARLAEAKVEAVRREFRSAPSWIVGADTIVYDELGIYAKPGDDTEAEHFLRRLSGKSHSVVTAVSLLRGKDDAMSTDWDVTTVRFAELSEDEIRWYLGTHEWQGVAGGYRIQGIAASFIEEIRGSYSTVMGLPIRTLYSMLKQNQYEFPSY
jgi:septum formation protein